MSKDAGFKVVAHMMPDLPNMGLERDTEQFIVCRCYVLFVVNFCNYIFMLDQYILCYYFRCFKKMCLFLQEFFENPAFRADGLKIYPTLVIRGTGQFFILYD